MTLTNIDWKLVRGTFISALASILVVSTLAGCAATPAQHDTTHPVRANATPSLHGNPPSWIGRWLGPEGLYMQIMPSAEPKHYRLTVKSTLDFTGRYTAVARGGALHFVRNGQPITIRPGQGNQTGFSDLFGQTDCLIVVPGVEGYCRTPGTADALPLTPGAYVNVTESCAETANNTNRRIYFDGRTLTRNGAHDCRASIGGQQGVIFTVLDNCANPNAGKAGQPPRRMIRDAIMVVDDRHFALKLSDGQTRLYKYCAGYNRPPPTPIRTSTATPPRSPSSAP